MGDVPWTFPETLLVIAAWLLILAGAGGVLIIPLLQGLLSPEGVRGALLPVSTVLLAGVTVLYVFTRHPGKTNRLLGPAPPTWTAAAYGAVAGIVAYVFFGLGLGNLAAILAEALQGEVPEVQETFRELAASPDSAPFLAVGATITAPIAEELLYRGMIFAALRRRLSLWLSMLISGGMFALNHAEPTFDGYLVVLVVITPLGMFLAWLYERFGTLIVPIMAHSLFNLPQVVLMIRETQT